MRPLFLLMLSLLPLLSPHAFAMKSSNEFVLQRCQELLSEAESQTLKKDELLRALSGVDFKYQRRHEVSARNQLSPLERIFLGLPEQDGLKPDSLVFRFTRGDEENLRVAVFENGTDVGGLNLDLQRARYGVHRLDLPIAYWEEQEDHQSPFALRQYAELLIKTEMRAILEIEETGRQKLAYIFRAFPQDGKFSVRSRIDLVLMRECPESMSIEQLTKISLKFLDYPVQCLTPVGTLVRLDGQPLIIAPDPETSPTGWLH